MAGGPAERPSRDRADGREATFPFQALSPGTNVLLAGPPMIGKYDLMLEVLAGGTTVGEAGVVVSSRDDELTVLDDFDRVAPDVDRSMLGVVECITGTESDGTVVVEDGARVRRAGSPADLTGIGIGASELMSEFHDAGATGIRLGIDTLSTMLLYNDFDRLCRFLHVLSGRIDRAGGVGLFVVNPGTIEAVEYDQLKTLFDGIVELREHEAGTQLRVRGLPGADQEWRSYRPPGDGEGR